METETTRQAVKKVTHSKRKGIGVIEVWPCGDPTRYADANGSSMGNFPFLGSEVHHMKQRYPFGFRTPENCSSSVCRWIYPITYGGGLVGGDHINAQFTIGPKCFVIICTQESTKVYHCLDSDESCQIMTFKLEKECLLCVLPDPLVCYKDAMFYQKQTFHIHPSSNLVFLDWLQAGRTALGESWDFGRYCNRIEIFMSNKLVFRESNDLENTRQLPLGSSMNKFQIMGTCIVIGSQLQSLAESLETKFGCKKGFGEKPSQNLVVSISPLSFCVDEHQMEGCYLRFLATDMAQASSVIKEITKPLVAELGADPFEHKL